MKRSSELSRRAVTGHSIPIPLSEVCNFYFYHRKWASSNPEWGENPPKPPSHHQGAGLALEWGGKSPPNPPSQCQGGPEIKTTTFSST